MLTWDVKKGVRKKLVRGSAVSKNFSSVARDPQKVKYYWCRLCIILFSIENKGLIKNYEWSFKYVTIQ